MDADTGQKEREAGDALGGKYLTFVVDGVAYGVEILRVQEIIVMQPVTAIPKAPACVRGVINLRGKVIPVVDLRLRFGSPQCEDTARTCIIVVRVPRQDETLILGAIADDVSEVMEMTAGNIEPPPRFGGCEGESVVKAVGKASNRVVMLLDVERTLADGEIGSVAA